MKNIINGYKLEIATKKSQSVSEEYYDKRKKERNRRKRK